MRQRITALATLAILAIAAFGQAKPAAAPAKQEGPPPMKLKVGDTAYAVVKASDVMIGK